MSIGRIVSLVLVDDQAELLGELAPFRVESPWWPDVEPIGARYPQVTVLRLLEAVADPRHPMGGRARYLAQVDGHPPDGLRPVILDRRVLDDHPLRAPYARIGGPDADLAWAATHVETVGAPRQIKTWNLSSLWRLATAAGPVWLKCTPPFYAHEGAMIQLLGPSPSLPRVIAAEGGRLLLRGLPGRDGFEATPPEQRSIIDVLVELQRCAAHRLDGLLSARVPDWRGSALVEPIRALVLRRGADRPVLQDFALTLPRRLEEIEACGLPDTVVHGDAHPGNARTGVEPPLLFDWGDSGLGHPLLDAAALARAPESLQPSLLDHWLAAWTRVVPGSDPRRAWRLLAPVAAIRAGLVYQRFLDAIEPSEQVYHRDDVEPALQRTERLLLAGAGR
jgi:hypothetical protein